jgi:hypothetical protein
VHTGTGPPNENLVIGILRVTFLAVKEKVPVDEFVNVSVPFPTVVTFFAAGL